MLIGHRPDDSEYGVAVALPVFEGLFLMPIEHRPMIQTQQTHLPFCLGGIVNKPRPRFTIVGLLHHSISNVQCCVIISMSNVSTRFALVVLTIGFVNNSALVTDLASIPSGNIKNGYAKQGRFVFYE